jgi:esterase/lipase superfamily enzyme
MKDVPTMNIRTLPVPSNRSVSIRGIAIAITVATVLGGCGTHRQYQIDLMPAPAVFDEDVINPLADESRIGDLPYNGILYVTDRARAAEGDKEDFYLNERGLIVRAGLGRIRIAGTTMTWDEARAISLSKTRSDKFPIQVDTVSEFGALEQVKPYGFLNDPGDFDGVEAGDQEFIDDINQKLAASNKKDIFIYVHGYKVIFENPLLVASELWHFLGYEGVFIAYSWPSTPKRVAYFKDIETSKLTARNLRLLLKFLAKNTDVERIHLVGYSAGTRVIIHAIHQLALERSHLTKEQIQSELRIANVILVGSDHDRFRFAGAVADGFLKVPAVTTIYESRHDSALGLSRFIFGEERLGELVQEGSTNPTIRDFLLSTDSIYFVDVSDAEESAAGNGHAYFRNSPWASSDLLMTMTYNLSPAERGLVHQEASLNWAFPADYVSRLRAAVIKADPALGKTREEQGADVSDRP